MKAHVKPQRKVIETSKTPPIQPEVISSITESVFLVTTSVLSVVVGICNKGFIIMILI